MPFNFSWLVQGKLAGMGRPRAKDTEWLREQGVTAVVSLTERAPDPLEGLDLRHVPIPDMTPPTLDQVHSVVGFIDSVLSDGGAVAIHCAAGMGRTGTMLAAYLVSRGHSAEKSIVAVRTVRPGSIETSSQEEIVRQFAELMGVDPA